MYVSPSCYIVQRFFKYYVTDDDVGNIETVFKIKTRRNLPKNHDLLFAVSAFSFEGIIIVFEIKTNAKKARRFDLSEVIFKGVKFL